MKLSNDSDRLKRQLVAPQTVLAALGLLDGSKRQARGFHILCPAHEEKTASCSVTEGSDGTLSVHCFGCDFKGDVFTLLAKVHSLDLPRDFPRVVAAGWKLAGEQPTVPPPRRRAAPPRRLPPHSEVIRLWAACQPMTDDTDLSRQLAARDIDPRIVAERNLARALPRTGPLPLWARAGSRWWRTAHRCILPLWNPAGEFVSLHARAVQAADGYQKGLLPSGHAAAGLFLTDAFALLILREGIPTWWQQPEPPRLFIAEGGIDFLTVACAHGEAEDSPAVLGVIAGSWSDALAARIPRGCSVWIMTHGDEAGLNYRDQIAESVYRRCRVFIEPRQAVGHA